MKKLSTNPVQNNATIFDRRRAEEELRRSDDQLLQAVRVAQFGIFDHDHLTGAVYWSPKYREIYGYSADEPASPPTFLASVHPDDLERIGAEILRAHDPAGAGAFDQEHRIVRRDGETRWVSTRSQTFFKAEGAARRPERTVGASIDITERKRADEQLALFRHSIEQAFVAVFWIDHRGGFTYVNEAACRSLGYDREELMRLQLWDIDPVYPREQWNKRWEEYERTKHDSVVRVESRHRRKDGSEFPVEVLCQFITVGDHAIHIAQVHDITEQKRAQEALTLFRTLIDHANDIIEVIDPETGRFLDVNNQACLAHGYTREEYLALTVADLDPVVADKSWEQIKKDMSGSGSIVLESLHRRKDGSAFPVEVNCVNIHLDRDYALAIVRDITERKRTEEALKASEARFRSAFENTAVGMMMIDAGGRFQRVNQAFCALVGYSEDELRAKTFLEITHPEDLEKNLPAVKQLMAGEMESFFVEKRYLHKQGHPVWVHASVAVVRDARGRPCGFIAQSQDITERRRAVEELERSVSLLHSTLESTADGILVVNHEGRIISFNQQFVEMWRLSAAVIDLRDDNQALAFVLDQLKEPEQFLKKVRELYDQPEAESFDVLEFKDGRIFERYSQPQKINGRTVGRVWSFLDVTERRRTEEAMRRSEERLQEAVRASQIGIFDHDHVNGTIHWSPEHRRIYGWGPDEPVTTQKFMEHVPPEDRQKITEALARSLDPSGDGLCDMDFRMIDRSGVMHWLSTRSRTYFEGEGDARRWSRTVGAVVDITERKLAEEALRRSENRFRSAMHNSAIGMAVATPEGRFLDVNEALCRMLGYSRDEFLTMDYRPITHPDDLDVTVKRRQALLRKGEAYQLEKRYIHKDGHVVWGMLSSALVRHEDGTPHYFIAQVQDITERKQAEEALRQSEERFRSAMHNSAVGMVVASPEGRFLDVNHALCRMLGYTQDELLTMNYQSITHPDDLDISIQRSQELLRKGEAYQLEKRYIHKDGHVVWGILNAALVRHEDGTPHYFISQMQDITERKLAEEALRDSEERFRTSMRNSPIGKALVALDGRFLDVNHSLCQIVGYTREELLATDFQSITYPDDLAPDLEHVRALLDGKIKTYRMEKRYIHKTGSIVWIQLNVSLVLRKDGTPHYFISQIQDISERKQAGERIARYMRQMRALSARLIAVREEERRALAQELHDEIGQNLTAAKIHLHAMEQAAQHRDLPHAENIHEALQAVSKTLEQVRGLSLNLRPLQLDDLGLPVALRSLLARDAEAGGWAVHFEEDLGPGRFASSLELSCYRVAQEALTNVLRHAGATEVWMMLQQSDHSLYLVVRDNGCGFDLASVRATAGSKSLGLLGMQERVEIANGHLEIRTRPGAGTEVAAIFPIVIADSGETGTSPEGSG